MSFKLDAYCYYNFCCSRFSSEIQESSEKGLLTIKDLLEVKNLLIFWIQKVRTECDVLLYLCVYFPILRNIYILVKRIWEGIMWRILTYTKI